MKETLDKLINFRVTETTRDRWKKEAKTCDMNLGDWIRLQVKIGGVGVPPTKKPTPSKLPEKRRHVKADPELIHHLDKIGGNINQIARWVNTHKESIDAIEVTSWLMSIEADIEQYRAITNEDEHAH